MSLFFIDITVGSLIKNIERLKRFDYLVRNGCTGNAKEFSRKMEISKSSLYDFIQQVEILGASIEYCKLRNTFYYVKPIHIELSGNL